MVMCPDHPGLTFNLSLVRTEPTYNQPIQQWTFVSDFAVSEPHFSHGENEFPVLKEHLPLRCATTPAHTR